MPLEPTPFDGPPFAQLQTTDVDTGSLDTVVATITIGTIAADDQEAQYVPPTNPFSIFTDYMISNRYESDKHIYMLPISSPGGFNGASVAFVQLASATLLWISDWTAARYNETPTAPDPDPHDPNWVLLDEHYEPVMLALAPDGVTPLYRLSGTYVYGNLNPDATVVNNIAYGRPPWMQDTFDRTVSDDSFERNLNNV